MDSGEVKERVGDAKCCYPTLPKITWLLLAYMGLPLKGQSAGMEMGERGRKREIPVQLNFILHIHTQKVVFLYPKAHKPALDHHWHRSLAT